ncbi:MAG: hypothetical protein HYW77_02015 [Parcubacteria group bacterium]|nr:hypothetical protein [Parcubacteria group bacterium]
MVQFLIVALVISLLFSFLAISLYTRSLKARRKNFERRVREIPNRQKVFQTDPEVFKTFYLENPHDDLDRKINERIANNQSVTESDLIN